DWHVLGNPNYKEGRSYYTKAPSIEEVRGWIAADDMLRSWNNWNKKIIIHHPDFEGVVMPHEKTSIQEPTKTNYSKVHFNKKGIHIVPYLRGRDD
ncbi:polymorphic toxin type 50 domain-containing protein, partial [Helicobacter suis]|uniref:polymorphic toxin type 50 domain-containing protein n=1 Tax=Helicobacter suis TaxID=104628 RepID=UPI002490B543